MNIVNLTPHTINILNMDKEPIANIPASGQVARLAVSREVTGYAGAVPLLVSVFGEPEGLPDSQPETIYIVSSLFRSGFDRPDLYVPGELVRDTNGQPVGCIGLSR